MHWSATQTTRQTYSHTPTAAAARTGLPPDQQPNISTTLPLQLQYAWACRLINSQTYQPHSQCSCSMHGPATRSTSQTYSLHLRTAQVCHPTNQPNIQLTHIVSADCAGLPSNQLAKRTPYTPRRWPSTLGVSSATRTSSHHTHGFSASTTTTITTPPLSLESRRPLASRV